jgi:Ca-activated chloride channel homolog
MTGKRTLPFLFAVLLMTLPPKAIAQIQTDPSLVYVHVAAIDRTGRYVTGLAQQNFKLVEDKAPQDIAYFSAKDDPISVGIMADVRGGSAKDAVRATASSVLMKDRNPGDEFFLIESADRTLNDSVYQGLNNLLQLAKNTRRALVLFTNRDYLTALSFSKVKEVLRDQDIQLYVVGVPEPGDTLDQEGRDLLRDIAELSGGNAFFPRIESQIESLLRTLALELRNQYVIGYRPTNSATDGKWRKIKVTGEFPDPKKNKVHKFTIRAKPGYYAPTVAAASSTKN